MTPTHPQNTNVRSDPVVMVAIPPLDPRERARLDELARSLALIAVRGSRLGVRRERSARGEYLEHALDRALLAEYHAARSRIHWIDPQPTPPAKTRTRGEQWRHEP